MKTQALFLGSLVLVASLALAHDGAVAGDEPETVVEDAKKGSESWAEWAKEKISEGLRFGSANEDQISDSAKVAEQAKEKVHAAGEEADEKAEKASELTESVKEAAEEHASWAKEKAKEGYEAAKEKAKEGVEAAKEAMKPNLEAASGEL